MNPFARIRSNPKGQTGSIDEEEGWKEGWYDSKITSQDHAIGCSHDSDN